MTADTYSRIYDVVEQIPQGNVATYGQVARLAGLGRHARLVGYALHACARPVPWHRVINARGEVSLRADSYAEGLQQRLLVQEGVSFDERGRVALDRYRWGDAEDSLDPGSL